MSVESISSEVGSTSGPTIGDTIGSASFDSFSPTSSISELSIPSLESPTPSIIDAAGGTFYPGFSIRELQALPEHTVNMGNVIEEIRNPFSPDETSIPAPATPSPAQALDAPLDFNLGEIFAEADQILTPNRSFTTFSFMNVVQNDKPEKPTDAAPSIIQVPFTPVILDIDRGSLTKPDSHLRENDGEKRSKPEEISSNDPQVETSIYEEQLADAAKVADTEALNIVIAQIQTDQTMTQEERKVWTQKFQKVKTQVLAQPDDAQEPLTVSQPSTATEPAIQTSTMSAAATETQPQTTQAGSKTSPEAIIGTSKQEQSPPPKRILWDVYSVTKITQIAKDTLNRRLKVAARIAQHVQEKISRRSQIRTEELDMPTSDEQVRISERVLEFPQIARKAAKDASEALEKDIEQTQTALEEAVNQDPPIEHVMLVKFEGKKETRDLELPAQQLAAQGANNILRDEAGWRAIDNVRDLKHFDELDQRKAA